jgi:hypothetical protein
MIRSKVDIVISTVNTIFGHGFSDGIRTMIASIEGTSVKAELWGILN